MTVGQQGGPAAAEDCPRGSVWPDPAVPEEIRTGRELEVQGVCIGLEEFGAEILWLDRGE